MPNSMLCIPQEACQFKTYSFMHGLCLLVWLSSQSSGLSGSLAPDTPGLIPHKSGSAPPTSLNRVLKNTSDFTAHCPTPWEVGCVWACSSLGMAKFDYGLLSPDPALRLAQDLSWAPASSGPWSVQGGNPVECAGGTKGWGRKICLCFLGSVSSS